MDTCTTKRKLNLMCACVLAFSSGIGPVLLIVAQFMALSRKWQSSLLNLTKSVSGVLERLMQERVENPAPSLGVTPGSA